MKIEIDIDVSDQVRDQIINSISTSDALNIFLDKATSDELKNAVIGIDILAADWYFTFETLIEWLSFLETTIGETAEMDELSELKIELANSALDVIKEIGEHKIILDFVSDNQ